MTICSSTVLRREAGEKKKMNAINWAALLNQQDVEALWNELFQLLSRHPAVRPLHFAIDGTAVSSPMEINADLAQELRRERNKETAQMADQFLVSMRSAVNNNSGCSIFKTHSSFARNQGEPAACELPNHYSLT